MKEANLRGKAWLKNEMRPYRRSIFLLTVLSVAVTLFSLAFVYTIRYLINSATDGQSKRLWIFSAVLMAFLLCKLAGKTLENYCAEKLRANMVSALRTRTFSKILRCEYAQIGKYHSGELMNRLTSDIQEVAAYSVGLLPVVVGIGVQCVGSVAALLTIDPIFTLVYVVAGAFFAVTIALFRKKLKQRQKKVLEADGAFRSYMQECIGSVTTIKAYGAESRTTEKAAEYARRYRGARLSRGRLQAGMSGIFSLLSNFGLIFALLWGGFTILTNADVDYGAMLTVVLLLMQLQSPLSSISTVAPAYYARLASGERLAELDEIPDDVPYCESEACRALYRDLQRVEFQNVSFGYDREEVFQGAQAVFRKGEIVCLVGESGAGKSTIFKLLLHVYKPTSGGIYADDTRITEAQRGLFAYVPQGNFLFSGTIYENLTFYAPQRSEADEAERLKNALTIACAEFVYELPEGLQTSLTERGGGLSEGQLQRLAVARAILSERPILLLDEATSALDEATEGRLLENIKRLADKTCLIVTHRPAALAIADRVLTVADGKILSESK